MENFNDNQLRMSSREIAIVGEKRHKHVLDAIRKMESTWTKVTGTKFRLSEYTDSTGRKLPMYNLTKTESLYVATKFDDELRARVILRWEQLEKEALNVRESSAPKAEPLNITIVADKDHGFLIIGRDVALGYGVSHNTIRCHLFHNKDKELFEQRDYFTGQDLSSFYPDLTKVTGTVYTQSGAVKMGNHVRGKRSNAFMDYLKNLFPKASHGETVMIPVPKKEKHDRLTKDRKLDLMQEIMQIKDDEVRIRLSKKLLEG